MRNHSQNGRSLRRGTLILFLGLAAIALGQAGCTALSEWVQNGFKVGPNYEPPSAPLPAQWIDANHRYARHGDPNLCSWWDVFDDPILTQLIHEAYSSNLTVRAAGSQILQAQIARYIAKSELLPQAQTAILSYTRSMLSRTGGTPPGPGPVFGTALSPASVISPVGTSSAPVTGGVLTPTNSVLSPVNPGVSGTAGPVGGGSGPGRYITNIGTDLNASWELDFWGLFRRNLEAADASLDQSVNNYDELVVLLLANVATQYVEIRTLQKRLELARKNVALQEPLVSVYEKRYKAGIANSFPGYFQLLSNLENTRALIPFLEIGLRQANNQLCILLGQPVHDLLQALGDGTLPDPADPKNRIVRIPQPREPGVVVGIPGAYLLRRPDVRAAEDELRIKSPQIGIAEAELLPHLGINGSIGLASNSFRHWFEGKSITAGIGPSLTWNILNYGRLLANVYFQNEQYRQLVSQYQQAILNANEDAENAMIAYLRTIDQAEHLLTSADAAAKLTSYLIRQYKEGFLPPGAPDTSAFINQLFTAINFQVTQQDVAAQAQGNIAFNLILLYRAMGGGWEIRKQYENDVCNRVQAEQAGEQPPATPTPEAAGQKEVLPPPRELPAAPTPMTPLGTMPKEARKG
jgi:NodT family efflux transporter outer membrane factor (OMF) lipoprotein